FTNAVNYNNMEYLRYNQQLTERYFAALRRMPPPDLARAYWENAVIYFSASSTYTTHAIVDRLPWRAVYDAAFSLPVLVLLLLAALALWLRERYRRRELLTGLGLLLPGLFIFLSSILFERGENMRFKYFLEPVIFVFLVAQLSSAARWVYRRALSRGVEGPAAAAVEEA
ncbi:MAG: hypothetical protein ACM3MF_08295, partial [Anaerolineae bacterium]